MLNHKQSIVQLIYKQQEFEREKYIILCTIESHDLKLNVTWQRRSPWHNIPDIDTYPLLKSQMTHHQAFLFKFNPIILYFKVIELLRLKISVKRINSAIMIALS